MNEEFIEFVSIQLMKNKKEALYVQLYEQLRELIIEGKLSKGYLLPAVRKFAEFLGINTGTVVSAYRELEKNGYIFSRAGSGSYVAEHEENAEVEATVEDGSEFEPLENVKSSEVEACINLASIALNPDLISVEAIKNVIMEVLERDQGYAFGYQDSQGFYPLRESIARDLKKHGVEASAQNVQIISGAQQGIDIVARALLTYGDYVFTEKPTYPGAIAAFRSRGAKIISVTMEEDGIDIGDLEEKLRKFRPKLLYIMPNIQNPTGCSYSIEKRNRLMGLARYYGVIILEDDYISELYYTKEPMAPLKAIDRDNRVIYLKSFSKIFMPGLRLAFLTMPPNLAGKLLAVKHTADISTSGLTQRAFDLYLRKGIWHDHISVIRKLYRERFEVTLSALRASMPDSVKCTKPSGGLSVWLTLPTELSAKKVVELARQDKVLLTEGNVFFPYQAIDRYIRISFATATIEEIQRGIASIGKAMKK
jgi:DNA-binding transcriptional MocR family regulator